MATLDDVDVPRPAGRITASFAVTLVAVACGFSHRFRNEVVVFL